MTNGVVFWRGESALSLDAPIVAIATGLRGQSLNPKTGPMVQAWVLRADMAPMDAKRANLDDAVCGDCVLRGDRGGRSACYVPAWQAPYNVYKAFRAGQYPDVTPADFGALLERRHLRLCAYGDPAAIPFPAWQPALERAAGWVGYTHQWRTCDPRFRAVCMASVENRAGMLEARAAGWRTFRVRSRQEHLVMAVDHTAGPGVDRTRFGSVAPTEFVCPASDEGGHRTTCQVCQLCRGTSSPARSVAIVVHGHQGARAGWRALQVVQ